MSKNFRTGNIDTQDLFTDDLTSADESSEPNESTLPSSSSTTANTTTAKGKEEIINELDSLRYVLDEGPEFQQHIPLLEDTYETSGVIPVTPDIHVPILTESCQPLEAETSVTADPSDSLNDIARASIDEVLDTLMKEYMPLLEARLRTELSHKLRDIISAKRTETPPQNPIDEN